MSAWEIGLLTRWTLLLGVVAAAASCSLDKRDDIAEVPWSCFEDTECGCDRVKPDVYSGGPSVEQCSAFDCCLYSKTETEFAFETCECFDSGSSCDLEAESRGGEVVDSCPPGTTRPAVCAEEGEACNAEYLSAHQLDEGCCEGLVCQPDSDDAWTCRPGSADELAVAEECAQAAEDSDGESFELLTPTLRTSVGDFELIDVSASSSGLGPQGCLRRVSLELEGTGIDCTISLSAEENGGKLVTSSVSAFLGQCEGYTGEPDANAFTYMANPPFEVTFEGYSCDVSTTYSEEYCTVGVFDWHLHGTVDGVTFDDQHVEVRATICGYSYGDCPSP